MPAPAPLNTQQTVLSPQKWSKKDHAAIQKAAFEAFSTLKTHFLNGAHILSKEQYKEFADAVFHDLMFLNGLSDRPSILPDKMQSAIKSGYSGLNHLRKYRSLQIQFNDFVRPDVHDDLLTRSIYALEILHCLQHDCNQSMLEAGIKSVVTAEVKKQAQLIRNSINKQFPQYAEQLASPEKPVESSPWTELLVDLSTTSTTETKLETSSTSTEKNTVDSSKSTNHERPITATVRKPKLEDKAVTRYTAWALFAMVALIIGLCILMPIGLTGVLAVGVATAPISFGVGVGLLVAAGVVSGLGIFAYAMGLFTSGIGQPITRTAQHPTVPAYEAINGIMNKLSDLTSQVQPSFTALGTQPELAQPAPKLNTAEKPDAIDTYLGQYSSIYHQDRSARQQFKQQRAAEQAQEGILGSVSRFVLGSPTN